MLPILFGVGAALAGGGVVAYGAISPGSQLFGRALAHGAKPRQLALTYDDGPNDACTPRLLEILAKHNVKATFFLVGKYLKQSPGLARQTAAAGHAVGNHTFNHPNLFFCSPAEILRELSDCEHALDDAVARHDKIFRPPWGARRPGVLSAARSLGLEPILWSVTCYDWKPTTAERVEAHAVRQIAPARGEIILLHDGGHRAMGADRHHSLAATEKLIARYKSEGYAFVTIPQMLTASK